MSCSNCNKPKVVAMYLPQYHIIPENSKFWGEGYTDWKAVKNNKPLFKEHNQPRIPLNNNYYDLSRKEDVAWQASLARKYGIDGFGIYHYWFNSNTNLLTKPAEIILNNKDIDIEFFFSWDNASWKRTWSNVEIGNDWAPLFESKSSNGKEILAELIYGDQKDWKKHFEYLLPFFKDKRYIKKDNRPLFSILNQDNNTEVLMKMCSYWDELAKEHGFDGIAFLGKRKNNRIQFTEYSFSYEPEWSGWTWKNFYQRISLIIDKYRQSGSVRMFNYDKIWKRILKDARTNHNTNMYYSGFVSYDDTPRRGIKGKIVNNASPQKFKSYFGELYSLTQKQGKEFVFLIAWNEWGEGAYLEPDTSDEYLYLEALQEAISD